MNYSIVQYSWRSFFIQLVGLILVYLLLGLLHRLLKRGNFLGRYQRVTFRIFSYIYATSLPLIILHLTMVFVLIKPMLHGLIIATTLLLTFEHLRNYISGIILRFGNRLRIGTRLTSSSHQGIVDELSPFDVRLRTSTGISQVGYHHLVQQGFSMTTIEQKGRLLNLKITRSSKARDTLDVEKIPQLLANNPYVDWNHRPVIGAGKEKDTLEANILLKEESNIDDLQLLLEEWGYEGEIVN